MTANKKRYAFISYSHKDSKWAKWLQNKLESYKLPADIKNEFDDSRYLRPIFRDKTDLNTGVLANELRRELEESKYLIVICSPNSAKSLWVSNEVKAFIEMGRLDHIIPFIISGTPHNYNVRDYNQPYDDECFPIFLRQYTKFHPELELLGISTKEVGKEKAFIRVVSRMLEVDFDVLWKRHERHKRTNRIVTTISGILLLTILVSFWIYNQPFDLKISYSEQEKNPNLPYVDGNIILMLDNDTLTHTINDIDIATVFKNIPRKYHNTNTRVSFSAFGYKELDTLIKLKEEVSLPIRRKAETYGLIQGVVLDSNDSPVYNAQINILQHTTTTEADGTFSVLLPLAEQNSSNFGYIVSVSIGDSKTEEKVYPAGDNNITNIIYIQ